MFYRLRKLRLSKVLLVVLGLTFAAGMARADSGQPIIAMQQTEVLKLILGLTSLEGLNIQNSPLFAKSANRAADKSGANAELLAAVLGVNSLDGLKLTTEADAVKIAKPDIAKDELLALILGIDSLASLQSNVQVTNIAKTAEPVKPQANDDLLSEILGIPSLKELHSVGAVDPASVAEITKPSKTSSSNHELLALILGIEPFESLGLPGHATAWGSIDHRLSTLGSELAQNLTPVNQPKVELILSRSL